MAWWSVFAVILLVTSALHQSVSRPSDPQPVPRYNVSLDASPFSRWDHVLADHAHLLPEINNMVSGYIPSELLPLIRQIAVNLEGLVPSPFAQEMIGIADYWGLNSGDVLIMNVIYDVTAFCTSIVAQDADGTVWHGRNLDYDFPDLLRNLTVAVDFKRGNETVYSGVTYAGYVGLLTGQKPNAFTVTVDQRGSKKRRLSPWWANELTAILSRSSSFLSFLVRQTLEETSDFKAAVKRLSTSVIHATAYIILGGVDRGEGVVITRDRMSALDRYYLDPLRGRWYVLETNYDRWTQPPPSDSQRRKVAAQQLAKLGTQGVGHEGLQTVLSTAPVLNQNTTYTTVMSASQPEVFVTSVRWPPDNDTTTVINN